MLTPEQRSEFAERGFFRLRGAFTRSEAAAMEERLWSTLNRKYGACAGDPSTWRIALATGLQPLRTHRVFDPIGGSPLVAALDELIGEGRWRPPKHWGQFLVSFPGRSTEGFAARALWHTDFPYHLPTDRLTGALVFSFLGEVPARSGGTLVIAGSHRVIARYLSAHPKQSRLKMKIARRALMSSDPWLESLNPRADEGDWVSRVALLADSVAGVAVEVVELTGEPGDIIVGHPWLLHTPTPNRGDRPRFMRVQRILQATPGH